MSDLTPVGDRPKDFIAELVEASAELSRLTAEAEALTDEEQSATEAALVSVNRQSPTEIKASLAAVRRKVVAKQAEVQAAAKKVRELAERQARIAQAAIAPLAKQIERFEDGIEAVNLYLGDAESIVTLKDGQPAPVTEPVHIRQLVLSMDEECAVASETGGIDSMDISKFDEWLLADPEHVDQVLPERKGIVALVPRMSGKDYGDPWTDMQLNKQNRETYLLIRNGERLYRYCPRFAVGTRLVPAADEFTRFFETMRFDPVTRRSERYHLRPGSREWAKAEEAADARQRHYMKVALLIQGIVDRSTMLSPLPPEGLDLLGVEAYDTGRAVIITDAEKAIGSGQQSFRSWLRETNRKMTVGMRIVGAFHAKEFRWDLTDERYYAHGKRMVHTRISPVCEDRPKAATIYTLEGRRTIHGESGFLFYFERTVPVWDYYGSKVPERRASCVVFPDDRFVLCLDVAEVDDMERFLQSRATRHDYVNMFPVLKAAIAAKKQEEAEEAPFRAMLAGELAKRNGVDVEDAVSQLPELIKWFKFSRQHHRALVGEDPKIVDAICKEHRRQLAERVDGPAESAVVAELRAQHPDLLYVGRKKDGTYVAFVPQEPDGWWCVYVTEIERTASGKEKVTGWRLPGARPNRWRELYSSEAWRKWDRTASPATYASRPEVMAAVETLRQHWDVSWGELAAITLCQPEYHDGQERAFWCWGYATPPEIDPDHPLTRRARLPKERHCVVTWHRGRGGKLVLGKLYKPYEAYYSIVDDHHDVDPIWRRNRNSRDIEVLFEDASVLARIQADVARYAESDRLAGSLSSQVHAALDSLRQSWLEDAERKAYAKFLDDYQDPERWYVHRKGLRIDWPATFDRAWRDLGPVVERLVESGISVAGRSVAEVLAVAAGLPAEDGHMGDALTEAPEEFLAMVFEKGDNG